MHACVYIVGVSLLSSHMRFVVSLQMPQGDQPADIERQIRDTWYSYIRKPDSIILAITAATQDIVACDALKTALEVDPEGDRTIGTWRHATCTHSCVLWRVCDASFMPVAVANLFSASSVLLGWCALETVCSCQRQCTQMGSIDSVLGRLSSRHYTHTTHTETLLQACSPRLT